MELNQTPVFRLKLKSESTVVCQYKGMLADGEELLDEDIGDVSQHINTIVDKNGENVIAVRYYKCNVLGGYLVREDKIPIYYAHANFVRGQNISGFLFNLYIFFIPDQATRDSITHPNNYVNKTMTGKFMMQLYLDGDMAGDEDRTDYAQEVEKYYRHLYTEEFNKELAERGRMVEPEIVSQIVDKRVKKTMDRLTRCHPVEFTPTVNKSIKELRKFLTQDNTLEVLVNAGLDLREKERIEKYNPGGVFSQQPDIEKIIDIGYLRDNPDKIDEYVDKIMARNK